MNRATSVSQFVQITEAIRGVIGTSEFISEIQVHTEDLATFTLGEISKGASGTVIVNIALSASSEAIIEITNLLGRFDSCRLDITILDHRPNPNWELTCREEYTKRVGELRTALVSRPKVSAGPLTPDNLQATLASAIESPEQGSLTSEWLTTAEAAKFFRIPIGSLRNLTSNGKIPYYKIPGTRSNRYRKSELQELLLSKKRGGSL